MKKFISGFNGVSTKYLNNYLLWNIWVNMKGHTLPEKADILLKTAVSVPISVEYKKLAKRPAIPLVA